MSKKQRKKNRNRKQAAKKTAAVPAISEKLRTWQDRLKKADTEFAPHVSKMDHREALYNGDRELKPMVAGDRKSGVTKEQTPHVRNIIFENIESMISAAIPQPKVTPRRKKDEQKAAVIEHWIRNELDRQPFELLNDMSERTVPIQGGNLFHLEWDEGIKNHRESGALRTSLVHPKQLAPQPGVYTGIEDSDWVILKVPTTKEAIWRRFGVSVLDQHESEPEVRGSGSWDNSDDAVTQYIGYARNDNGGIDKYSWVNNIELLDEENYQARRLPTCTVCGRVRPMTGQVISHNVFEPEPEVAVIDEESRTEAAAGRAMAGMLADRTMEATEDEIFLEGIEFEPGTPASWEYDGGACPWCGNDEWEMKLQEYEQVILPIKTTMGTQIPGGHFGMNEMQQPVMVPTKVPFYIPNVYPVVLQRSVSVFGQLLGNSDVDAIEDQQNTTNRLEKKIIDRILKAGSRITLPPKANLRMDPNDGERWYLTNPADKQYIGLYEFKGNLQYEMMYLSQVYEESRQILGITDSFQGRTDPTATSGKAKEFSASMAAGRQESKRILKNAAYAQMFELMFKLALAYADEPRPVTYRDSQGETQYEEFNRYDFLEQDEAGEWYWNDNFLFSCDTSAPLANNREAMWQENRMNLQTGAFGDPAATETLILFWSKMEMLHYPGAAETKKFLEDRRQREQEMQRQMILMQQQQMAMMQGQQLGMTPGMGTPQPAQQPVPAMAGI